MCWVQTLREMDEAALAALGAWQPSNESVEAVRAIVRDANLAGSVAGPEWSTSSCRGLCVDRPPDERAGCREDACGLEQRQKSGPS